MRHLKHVRLGMFRSANMFVFAGILFALLALSAFSGAREPFSSAEVKFTDASAGGLAIMPASCPSDPHWEGECNPECIITATPSSYNAGSVGTIQIHWEAQQPPPENDSQITTMVFEISGIGGVYRSGTLDVAAPQSSFVYKFDGAYLDTYGTVLGSFTCSAPVTVNNIVEPPVHQLYINQTLLYRSAGEAVAPGDIISYRMYIRNSGTADQNWMQVRDRIPAYTTLNWQGRGTDYTSCDQIASCVDGSGDIWWSQQYAPAGWSGYVDFNVRVNADAPSGAQICNTGRISSQEVGEQNSNTICNPVAVSPPENATIQGFKVVAGNYASITSQPVTVSGVGTDTDNPYAFTVAAGQPYTVSVPAVNGYTIGYTLCMDRTDCHGAPPVSGNSVRVDIPSGTGHFADLWWHYIPDTPVPTGYFDGASCSTLDGWAYDPQNPSTSIAVHLYDGSTFVGEYPTNVLRSDVNDAYGITGNHGFSIATPASLKDGVSHAIHVYAINTNGSGPNPELNQSPRSVQCEPRDVDNGCTLRASPSNLPDPGTVTLSASIDAYFISNWEGTLTGVGAVGKNNPGPWQSAWIDEDTPLTLEGSYTFFGVFGDSFSCSTAVSVDDEDDSCDLANPIGDPDCTCEQGNTEVCTEDNQCVEPLTRRCSDDGRYWATYDANDDTTDGNGNVCGPRGDCLYAEYGFTCVDGGGNPYCPEPNLPDVDFTVSPTIVHKDDRTSVGWTVTSDASSEPIACTVSSSNANDDVHGWGATADKTQTFSQPSSPIRVQTSYSLNCEGTLTHRETFYGPIFVNIIPDFQEL